MCYNEITLTKNVDRIKFPHGLEVKCGKCIECRKERAREKAIRFIHEYETRKDSKILFITWTLDEEKLKQSEHYYEGEYNTTLNKNVIRKIRDKIYSRLYRYSKKKFDKKEDYYTKHYKYMIAGEYGGEGTKRAHYHLIIITDKYHSKIRNQWLTAWEYGNIKVEEDATIKSIYYTAGYVSKKIGLKNNDGREEPFLMISRGMGKEWAIQNADELKERKFIYYSTKRGSAKTRIFRYYLEKMYEAKKWNLDDIDEYREELQQEVKNRKRKLFEQVIEPTHKIITGKGFDIDEDITELNTAFMFTNYKNEYHNVYYNYHDKAGNWHNSIFETYKIRLNEMKKTKALAYERMKEQQRSIKNGKYESIKRRIQ